MSKIEKTFVNGQPLPASDLNAIVTAHNATDDEVAQLETQIGQVGDVLDAINGEEV